MPKHCQKTARCEKIRGAFNVAFKRIRSSGKPYRRGRMVYSKARLSGISVIRKKKIPHKIYVNAANEAHKIVPKDKYLFSEIKYSTSSLTVRLILPPLYTTFLFIRLFLCLYSVLS